MDWFTIGTGAELKFTLLGGAIIIFVFMLTYTVVAWSCGKDPDFDGVVLGLVTSVIIGLAPAVFIAFAFIYAGNYSVLSICLIAVGVGAYRLGEKSPYNQTQFSTGNIKYKGE